MKLATVTYSRLLAALVCGYALGFLVGGLDVRSSSAPAGSPQHEMASSGIRTGALHTLPTPHKPECNHTIADSLMQRVRVLCCVLTCPQNHATKATAVNATWGQHCDKLLFMSSKHDPTLPTVALNVSEGHRNLWSKTKAAFRYIVHEGLLENIDWVLKADDDTFIVMENLRYLLLPLDASRTIFGGLRLRPLAQKGFMSGGAGYILSRMAALRFVEQGLSGAIRGCINPGPKGEDVCIGRYMSELNATFLDTRDADGLERFHAYAPEDLMMPNKEMDWLKNYSYHKLQPASKCCSSAAVSFHYITPSAMRAIYYLVYRLKAYGLNECELPKAESLKMISITTEQQSYVKNWTL